MTDTPPFTPPNLTPQTACTLVEVAGKIPDLWCIYEHHLHDPETGTAALIYVGASHLRDAYTMAEARRNSEWQKIVKPTAYIYVKVIYTGEKNHCRNEIGRYVHRLDRVPRCNLFGRDTLGASHALICSNGKEYRTQTEAARDLGLNQGQLSLHLSGKVNSVSGYTFVYKE